MKVYRSNRVENLLDALVDVVSVPLPDPLEDEAIVVNSRGMNTWLSTGLAQRLGIWAGGNFVFPRRFFDEVMSTVQGSPHLVDDRSRTLWRVLESLPSLLDHAAFSELSRFVTGDHSGQRRFGLAQRIATTFDQYAVFRPQMVLGWDRGKGDDWQAILWRAVQGPGDAPSHAAARAKAFVDALRRAPRNMPGLPTRVSLFGLSTLPPFHIELLDAIDQIIDVHLFIVSPSREYWAEVRSTRELLRRPEPPPELLPELGDVHRGGLLGAFGSVGRDFQRLLESTVDYEEPAGDLYREPTEAGLLGTLQGDLLHMRSREAGNEFGPVAVPSDDDSIELHACHSPMREVEVLHDRLLDALERDPELEPRDVVVLLPDVATYAPLVEAVFERGVEDPSFIPYCVSDKAVRADSPVVDGLHRILDLVGARLTATEVLDVVALPAVTERFGITATDIDTISNWVAEAGIRWGIDAAHRKRHGQPNLDENTWRFGLERLFLGYAMPGRGVERFEGVLPYDELEGQSTILLGLFTELCERLFEIAVELEGARTPRKWQATLGCVIDRMLSGPDDAQWDVQSLRDALEEIASESERAGFEGTIGLPAMRALLEERLEDGAPARGFLAGGVTFCAMLPMRSVPFDVVCILGLGDAEFPRGRPSVGFDKIAASPRPGDRSRRADDRYLFLEALLGARKRVLLSYVGQSIQDNSDIPPSVVVSELLDELGSASIPAGADAPDPERLRTQLTLRHPMQPFSPRYFGADPNPRLFSYAEDYKTGAEALLGLHGDDARAELLTQPLDDPRTGDAVEDVLTLANLLRFFRMPAADLVKRRLGIYLEDFTREHNDREPMELDQLEQWRIGDRLLSTQLSGVDAEEAEALLAATGELPLGSPGHHEFSLLRRNVEPLIGRAAEIEQGSPLPLLPIDLAFGRTRLVGTLGRRWPTAMAAVQYAKLGAQHLLSMWIRHLALCCAAPSDQEHTSVIVARAPEVGLARRALLRAPEEPQKLLGDLVDLYWLGQREPLLLFPKSAYAFCETFMETRDHEPALAAARKPWTANLGGERNNPHLKRLLGDADPLQPGFSIFDSPMEAGDFPTLALRVFSPLIAHLEDS